MLLAARTAMCGSLVSDEMRSRGGRPGLALGEFVGIEFAKTIRWD